MLKRILSGSTCAKCRICCVFDDSDIWEIPLLTKEQAEEIRRSHPEAELLSRGDSFVFDMKHKREDGLYACPMLGENGCMLGDDKPFDCRIWPFRVNDFCGRRVITLSPVCGELYGRPLSELCGLLDDGLAERIFAYAAAHPDIVKEYIDGYPILRAEIW